MFQPNSSIQEAQGTPHPMMSSNQDSPGAMQVDLKNTSAPLKNNVKNAAVSHGEYINFASGTKETCHPPLSSNQDSTAAMQVGQKNTPAPLKNNVKNAAVSHEECINFGTKGTPHPPVSSNEDSSGAMQLDQKNTPAPLKNIVKNAVVSHEEYINFGTKGTLHPPVSSNKDSSGAMQVDQKNTPAPLKNIVKNAVVSHEEYINFGTKGTPHPPVSSYQESTGAMQVDQKNSTAHLKNIVKNSAVSHEEYINFGTKKFQDDLEMLGLKIKQHEENINFLTNQKNVAEKSILDLPVVPKMNQEAAASNGDDMASEQNLENTVINKILQHDKSAAAVFLQLNTRHSNLAASLSWNKDVLGVVSLLGRIEDDNLSRILSEYLGINNMMAIVCKTFESFRALETYDTESNIIRSSGLHGLGASMGRPLDGRFLVICLENLRSYIGKFLANDPQKRLDLEKPRLPNGECPPGFIGYAVNMITIESTHLYHLTSSGFGLRETLFHHLFSRLQIYKTRSEMLQALPCISDGAVSLDGGIIKTTGVFSLGYRQEIDVIFPKSCGMVAQPVEFYEREVKTRELEWKKEMIAEDIRRERSLLQHSQTAFAMKKQEYIQFLAQSSLFMSQQHVAQ